MAQIEASCQVTMERNQQTLSIREAKETQSQRVQLGLQRGAGQRWPHVARKRGSFEPHPRCTRSGVKTQAKTLWSESEEAGAGRHPKQTSKGQCTEAGPGRGCQTPGKAGGAATLARVRGSVVVSQPTLGSGCPLGRLAPCKRPSVGQTAEGRPHRTGWQRT